VRQSICVTGMLCFFAGSVMADQVTLKNGDRLTGTIVKSDAKTLLIKTEFAGEVNVQRDAVSAMVSSQTLHLDLKDGQTIVETVTAADNKFDVATKETGPVTASKDAVAAVRNDAEQKAYDQQVERLRHPHLLDFWSGMLDTGLSLTRGNSDSLTYALTGKAVRATERDKITVYSGAIYTKSTVNGVSSTSAHSIRGGVRGDLNVREKWFVFGFTDFEYDAFQHLDLRNVLGGGLGYHVVKTEKTTFDLFGGGDFEQEYFSPNPPTVPASLTRKSGEIVVGEELNTKLSSRMTLSERFAFYPNLRATGSYRYQFDTSAATKLKNWLSWQITFSDRFLSDPLPGLKKNDLLLSTGVRLTFGKGAF
jgi:putative salt-induced outer membrane protein YdiY